MLVKYIGGVKPKPYTEPWGGTVATNDAIIKAFDKYTEFTLDAKFRQHFSKPEQIKEFIKGADIVHVDDTFILEMMLPAGIIPDVIGPIARSPIKKYGIWKCPYTKEDFYKAKVIRLNYSEERDNRELVTLIRHGVDTEYLKPLNKKKTDILWAGDRGRYAKNFEMWEEIQKITNLPEGYKFKTLSSYSVKDYWEALDTTAILINTSRFESFCCAMAEARSKEVPVIYKEGLHGGDVQKDGRLQVRYEAFYYKAMIEWLLANPEELEKEGKLSREYIVKNHSLKAMRYDIAQVYREVLDGR